MNMKVLNDGKETAGRSCLFDIAKSSKANWPCSRTGTLARGMLELHGGGFRSSAIAVEG
jgi:hypothetical protein